MGDAGEVFVVLLSAVVDHGGMKRKETAMDRGAAEVNMNFTCVRIRFADLRFQLGAKKWHHFIEHNFTIHWIVNDPSVRGNTPM
jgi:hypothetical protein